MRAVIILMTIHSLFVTPIFANTIALKNKTFGSKFLIKSFVSEYARKIEADIAQYNRIRRDPKSLIKLVPKKDQQPMLDILIKHKIKEFPEIKNKGVKFQVQVDKNIIEFNLVTLYKNSITINNKIYTFKTNDYREFNSMNTFLLNSQSSLFMDLIINEANAALLPIAMALLGAATLIAYFINKNNEEKEINEQMSQLNKEIIKLNQKCEEELPFIKDEKPNKTLETLSLLSLFTINNKLQRHDLEYQLYAVISKKSIEKTIGDDPISCEAFAKHLVAQQTSFDKKMRIAEGRKSLEDEICANHSQLKNCLTKFNVHFRKNDSNRSIGPFINDYIPTNDFLKRSLQK